MKIKFTSVSLVCANCNLTLSNDGYGETSLVYCIGRNCPDKGKKFSPPMLELNETAGETAKPKPQ